MTLRPPPPLPPSGLPPKGFLAIDYEIANEQAASLGRAGRLVEERLTELAGCDGPGEVRRLLVKAAADAVFAYFIQREMFGFLTHEDAIREYAIPREVLAQVGVS